MTRYRLADVVQRVIRPFSRLFHRIMSNNSEELPKDVFPEYTSVEQWYNSLLHLGWLPRKELAVSIRDKCRIKRLYLCKSNRTRSLHEYIVAAVEAPDGTTVRVHIDRVRGEPRPAHLGRTLSGSPMPPSATSSPSSSVSVISPCSSKSSIVTRASNYLTSSFPDTRRAEDNVQSSLNSSPPSDIAQCLVFKAGREPPLTDLVFVSFAAHEYDPTYKVLGPQCYWYAICIYELMKELVGESGYEEQTKYSAKLERSPSKTDSITAGIYFPGDVGQALPQDSNTVATAVDPSLSPELWSPHRVGTNYNVSVTRTPKKVVIGSIRHKYEGLKQDFESNERDRIAEQAAHEADRQARIAAEDRVHQLEEQARRYTEAIESLRTEVARLQAAESQQ